MSDHWNSLANLLGTPSVDPIQRKVAVPATANKLKSKPVEDVAIPIPTGQDVSSSHIGSSATPESLTKPEPPSRIRASWDAVARMFGVAAPADSVEAAPKQLAVTPPTSPHADEDLFAGFKGRGEKDRPTPSSKNPAPSSSKGGRFEKPTDPPTRIPDRQNKPSSFVEQPEDRPRGKRRQPSLWESSDESPAEEHSPAKSPTQQDAPPSVSSSNPREVRSREVGESDQPDRRGRQRNIRRGRDTNAKTEEPRAETPERESREPRAPQADRSDRGNRSVRGGRSGNSERGSRPERTEEIGRVERNEGPARPARSESSDRPARSESSERGQRSGRAERSEREPRKGRSERSPDVRRDEPAARTGVDRNISDFPDEDDLFAEVSGETTDSRDFPRESASDSEELRPRRRRRGRRGSSQDVREERDDGPTEQGDGRQAYGQHMIEDEDDQDAGERITKITSWTDAISALIDSNMENHKRNPGQDHRGRGGHRGPPRRRGGNSGSR